MTDFEKIDYIQEVVGPAQKASKKGFPKPTNRKIKKSIEYLKSLDINTIYALFREMYLLPAFGKFLEQEVGLLTKIAARKYIK